MTDIHNTPMGVPKHPTIRRAKPRKFQRPSVAIGENKREWHTVRPHQLRAGDTVPGIGLLTEVVQLGVCVDDPVDYLPVRVSGGDGNTKILSAPVYAFTLARP